MIVIFEGINGAGKTTLIKEIKRVHQTRKKSNRFIQQLTTIDFPSQDLDTTGMQNVGKMCSYIADFNKVMLNQMGRARAHPHTYLMDRSFISTAVYQKGYEEDCLRLGADALISPTVYKKVLFYHIDCDPYEAANRITSRKADKNKDKVDGPHNFLRPTSEKEDDLKTSPLVKKLSKLGVRYAHILGYMQESNILEKNLKRHLEFKFYSVDTSFYEMHHMEETARQILETIEKEKQESLVWMDS